jgi:hypothetical protein
MAYYLVKLFITAALIVLVSEIAKFNATLGGLIKSLPLISIMALIWLYLQTQDTAKAAALSTSTFWFVLPTLPMFLFFPFFLEKGIGFYGSLGAAILIMLLCYLITIALLKWFGIHF